MRTALQAEYTVSLEGEALHTRLKVTNTGDQPFTFTASLHSYFAVGVGPWRRRGRPPVRLPACLPACMHAAWGRHAAAGAVDDARVVCMPWRSCLVA